MVRLRIEQKLEEINFVVVVHCSHNSWSTHAALLVTMTSESTDVVKVHECPACMAIIPYPGCAHNCPELKEDKEFHEIEDFFLHFAAWIKTLDSSLIVVVPSP